MTDSIENLLAIPPHLDQRHEAKSAYEMGLKIMDVEIEKKSSSTFKLSVFTSNGQLTKTITMRDGTLEKTTPIAGSGSIETVDIRLDELPKLIGRLDKKQCLIHGTCAYDKIDITPVDKPKAGAVHRTKKYFLYPTGKPGLAMLDHDPDGVGAYFGPDDLVDAVAEVFPQFADAARVVKLSTSAEIFDDDGIRLSSEQPGYHIYFVAADASDLPRFKEVLFKRLWLHGRIALLTKQRYGHCRLSKAGSVLVRGVFDKSVYSPERCDFVSGAVLGKGLEQRLPSAKYTTGGMLDTSKLVDLTAEEEAEFQEMVAAEREHLKPEQEPVRREYSKVLAERTGEAAEVVYERLCTAEIGMIHANTVVKTKSGDLLTIAELVKQKRHGEYVEDPTEISDVYARLYINGGEQAVVRSFLHGGTSLRVVWGELAAEKPSFDDCVEAANGLSAESTPDEINKALEVAIKAKPNPIEKRQILAAMKEATKIPMGDLGKGFDSIRKEQAGAPEDLAHVVAKTMLKKYYANGLYLVRAIDRNFWRYNSKHWERQTDEQVQRNLLSIVNETVDPEDATYASTVRAALALTISMQAADGDILRLTEEPPSVINCQNGELWIESDGKVELRPHSHDSYSHKQPFHPSFELDETCSKFAWVFHFYQLWSTIIPRLKGIWKYKFG